MAIYVHSVGMAVILIGTKYHDTYTNQTLTLMSCILIQRVWLHNTSTSFSLYHIMGPTPSNIF